MSIEEKDHAQRCDRCQRVTLGTRQCTWKVDTGLEEHVAVSWRLCTRCRSEARNGLHLFMQGIAGFVVREGHNA